MSRLYDYKFNAGPQPIFKARSARIVRGPLTGEPCIIFGLAASAPAVYLGDLRVVEDLRDALNVFLAGEYAQAVAE